MVTIRPALHAELDAIWALVQRAVAHMNALGNLQWGAEYPTRAFYEEDIAREDLYAALSERGVLLGVACINTQQSPEYAAIAWNGRSPAVVVHRMAVDPEAQRGGVGRAFFAWAEALALAGGLSCLRLDTYSQNDRMQALLVSLGFRRVGEIHLHGRPLTYPCFEKLL